MSKVSVEITTSENKKVEFVFTDKDISVHLRNDTIKMSRKEFDKIITLYQTTNNET